MPTNERMRRSHFFALLAVVPFAELAVGVLSPVMNAQVVWPSAPTWVTVVKAWPGIGAMINPSGSQPDWLQCCSGR